MPRNPTAQGITDKWATAMAQPQTATNYKNGVMALTVSPTQQAATQDALNRYQQNCAQSVANGTRAAALNAVDLGTYQNLTTTKGPNRLGPGATAAKPKMLQVMQKWAGVYGQVSQQVSQLPKGGLANAQARSALAIQLLMQAAGHA
jgi:hypothetical protein